MTLIHAFVSSHVYCCCSLLIGSPRSVTDKLKCVLNAAVRVITNSSRYKSGLSQTLYHDLHWLDVTERIQFQVATTVYQCLHSMAPIHRTWLNCLSHHCISKSSSWASVGHNQQPGHTTLQTDDLRHQSFQCRWSSLLEHFTGLLSNLTFLSIVLGNSQKHFYFVNIDTSPTPSTAVAH